MIAGTAVRAISEAPAHQLDGMLLGLSRSRLEPQISVICGAPSATANAELERSAGMAIRLNHGMKRGVKQKVTVSIDEGLLARLDDLVQCEQHESRSAAMEAAIVRLLDARADAQFERALAALTSEDVQEMQEMAEDGLADYADQLAEYPW